MCDIHLALKRLVTLRFDGLLEQGKQDFVHFLGTSKLEWGLMLTAVQRAVRKYHNPNFTVTYDCASPFLCTANGQIYHNIRIGDRNKWSYMMSPSIDDKKYASDTRKFSEAIVQEGVLKAFEDSPVSEVCEIKDICVYKPGDLNKNNKEGKTSWDSFSYAYKWHIMYGHTLSQHNEQTENTTMDCFLTC